MPQTIVIRLHPEEPTSPQKFAAYLAAPDANLPGLEIIARDITFEKPGGEEIGSASYNPMRGQSRIIQDYDPGKPNLGPAPDGVTKAVATALIVLSPNVTWAEYDQRDLLIEVKRGSKSIIKGLLRFNVTAKTINGPLPVPPDYDTLEPVGLYIKLPSPEKAIDLDKSNLDLPADGSPPNFKQLLKAVEEVLQADPGDLKPLTTLTPAQAWHIARELIYRKFRKQLPDPPRPLGDLYTKPNKPDLHLEADRKRFEGEIQGFYATLDGDAERLAKYVLAVSTALANEATSKDAIRANFHFPVRPLLDVPIITVKNAEVTLTGVSPRFVTPAEYFYALTANLPVELAADERYAYASRMPEAEIVKALKKSADAGVISGVVATYYAPNVTVTREQAARRLVALGAVTDAATLVAVSVNQPPEGLLSTWLAIVGDIEPFWKNLPGNAALWKEHFFLVLCAITKQDDPFALINALKQLDPLQPPDPNELTKAENVAELATLTERQWRHLLQKQPGALPKFIQALHPNSLTEQIKAFIQHLKKFFGMLLGIFEEPVPEADEAPPQLALHDGDPVSVFLAAHPEFAFDKAWFAWDLSKALQGTFPGDEHTQKWLAGRLTSVQELYGVTDGMGLSDALRLSIAEALYARGFATVASVKETPLSDFVRALLGTVAYGYAHALKEKLGGAEPKGKQDVFKAVNPDGTLANCVPPEHLSPLGPSTYLRDLLLLQQQSTCAKPYWHLGPTLKVAMAERRGPLGELLVTRENLAVVIPRIDLVNESLEALVAGKGHGAVFDTAAKELAEHKLLPGPGKAKVPGQHYHAPDVLFAVVPEHSSPATPIKQPNAYAVLRGDFSAPSLPYAQALDISRSYLLHLHTDRFRVARGFRRAITEFVLAPAKAPKEFREHQWRYPVKEELAAEYLGLSGEELDKLFKKPITDDFLLELYGFTPAHANTWIGIVTKLPEFLRRTGLSYCEFLELWRSKFVPFASKGGEGIPRQFADCPECYLDQVGIEFDKKGDTKSALMRLIVFIRLWRKMQALAGARYSLTELRDICVVLRLFDDKHAINPDFIRQLAAFQLLRDEFGLELVDRTDKEPGQDADRTHLLTLWVGPKTKKWSWAVDHLLDRIRRSSEAAQPGRCRPPEFLKHLKESLDPLSILAGFDPGDGAKTWHALPTHTLRFAEILAKIHASQFGVGELLYLLTADEHLRGDDPFALQTSQEAHDLPLDLADGAEAHELWSLRKKLLDADVTDEDEGAWTYRRIETVLAEDFGYTPADPLRALAEHFFPAVLAEHGPAVEAINQQYRVKLADTKPVMWNTPPEGPFRYDAGAKELYVQLPLTDEAVVAKLARVRQLTELERQAVLDVYYAPRVDLARFAFLFPNLEEAEVRLIAEANEGERWRYFRRSFARFHRRCEVVAAHLAAHVGRVTGPAPGDERLAWRLLRHLLADENLAVSPWESDGGKRPQVKWGPTPTGGAFAAILGLVGTGLLGEITAVDTDDVMWNELRGPMTAFGQVENAWNTPLPTIIPSMGLTLAPEQLRLAGVRNGFALANADGAPLGGAQGFCVRWRGVLLIEQPGVYGFFAGAPTPDGAEPDAKAAQHQRWRVTLRSGYKTWVLLSHRWEGEVAPSACSTPITLKRGACDIVIELVHCATAFDDTPLCPQTTGFQIKYTGADTDGRPLALPFDRLFLDSKDATLDGNIAKPVVGQPREFLGLLYTSSLRDIRRTYQRAFKALLFASRLGLSATPQADSGESEIGYLLAQADRFSGLALYPSQGVYKAHFAELDLNFLPLRDNYLEPPPSQDDRVKPSVKRQQALFDWWERLHDYTELRAKAQPSPEQPVWLAFHEASEAHPDDPAHLLRHMGVDLSHAKLVLRFYQKHDVPSADLEDEIWAVRAWRADMVLRTIKTGFLCKDIRRARPDLWASDDPGVVEEDEIESGNANLTRFVRDGSFENKEPHRYEAVKQLNDGLRERARQALLAYLCSLDHLALPWGGHAKTPKDVGDLLLMDVESGLCQQASRIQEAISSVQLFVQRSRLGLEPKWLTGDDFAELWARHFSTFRIWQACERKTLYRENYEVAASHEQARKSEGYRLFEAELRRSSLSIAEKGGMAYWTGAQPPAHAGISPMQAREPMHLTLLNQPREGLNLMGRPERDARPSLLTAVPVQGKPMLPGAGQLPFWFETAIRMGIKFWRIAAAGLPPASITFDLDEGAGCCTDCDGGHEPFIDEYYFWLADAKYFKAVEQDARWNWHSEDALPKLLHWGKEPMVHLMWTRIHNGGLQQFRRSHDGVRVPKNAAVDLKFLGRKGDSLHFEIIGGVAPPGFPIKPEPGFRYDLTSDEAIVLPTVNGFKDPEPFFGLPAYPYFLYFQPGAPLMPPIFSVAVDVAEHLRSHCRYEEALNWLELSFHPLKGDNAWCSKGGGVNAPGASIDPDPTNEDHLEEGPCCQHGGVTQKTARTRAITLLYLELLLEWGDALMRGNSPEALQKARLIYDTAARILGATPMTIIDDDTEPPQKIADFSPHPATLNPRLMSLYERNSDRLALIRNCLNARRFHHGRHDKDMLYFGDDPVRDGWQSTAQVCLDDGDWCYPFSPYRFLFLSQKAQELAGEVRALGAALLAAYEKGDAEYLASLRATHEKQLLVLALEIRKNAWRESDWQVQALQKAKQIAQTRRDYYANLILQGLISGELQYQSLTNTAMTLRASANVSEGIAQSMQLIPDLYVGFPVVLNHLPLGTKLAGTFMAVARILNTLADISNTQASLQLTEAGWVRREDEWRHQVEVLDIEIEQIERQILAAERRRDIALRELNNHQRQIEQASEILDFLRDKFTNHELYLWMQRETAALHYRMYELALHTARQAQRAYNYERGHTSRVFVPGDAWDNLREGLLAGERLILALRRMEKSYLDENLREYELTKHFSLRLLFPLQLLQLKTLGYCEVELPEWLFDLDYPGHFMRRIRNVTLSLPAVVGPYAGIHCRLTLLSSTTRIDPRLRPREDCCEPDHPRDGKPKKACSCETVVETVEPVGRPPSNGYLAHPDDPRIVRHHAATEAIATSSGTNDAGMFELNFRDERYLPFEFAGAVSRWRIELPPENNFFDLDSLSDVILHLNYTAREGGSVLAKAASKHAQRHVPDDGHRLFDVRHEFPTAWQRFQSRRSGKPSSDLVLEIGREMFPFLPGQRELAIRGFTLLLDADGAEPSTHHRVEFIPGGEHRERASCCGAASQIECVGSAEWPGMYHGAHTLAAPHRVNSDRHVFGTLRIPVGLGELRRVFLIVDYEAKDPSRGGGEPR